MHDAKIYRWHELSADRPMELLERRRILGERMTVARIVLQKGCYVPTHHHDSEQISLIMSGRLRFGIGDEGSAERREIVVKPGETIHLPSNVPHSALAEEETVVLDLFAPPALSTGIDAHAAAQAASSSAGGSGHSSARS